MKKAIKIIIASVLAVVVLLGAAAVTLALIKVEPMEQFEGYNNVTVVDSINDAGPGPAGRKEIIEDSLKTVKFTMIRAMFTGNLDYKIKLNYQTVNEDEEYVTLPEPVGDKEEPVTIEGRLAASKIKAYNGEFMIRFDYTATQTNSRFRDENGNKISFNTLVLIIPASNGKIQKVSLYPYTDTELSNEYYSVYQFSAKMYTSKMYDTLVDEGFTPAAALPPGTQV